MNQRYRSADLVEDLHISPVIAAVKSDGGLARALESECAVVFLLYGTILNIGDLSKRVREAGKRVFIHADLVEGMSGKDISMDYLASGTVADGVISTRPNLIRRAKELDLLAIQRFFLLDSIAFENILRQNAADLVDVLPGAMPAVLKRLTERLNQPCIASGLLRDKSDVMSALSAGALAVSTTCESLWFV